MKNKKRFFAKMGAGVLALAAAFLIIGGISQASGEGNEPFLGKCIEFGVVCNEFNQTGDVETNFATGKYTGNGHTTGNTVGGKTNAAGEIRIGEVVGELKTRDNPVVFVDESVKEEVKELLAAAKKYADSVVDKADVDTAEIKDYDMNSYVLDISAEKKDTVYVAADAMMKDLEDGKIANGGLKVKMRADQSMILNVTKGGKVTIPRYTVKIVDGDKSTEEIAQTVIWNMPKVADLKICSDGMHATVIAPLAGVNIDVTGEGWLLCDQIVSTGGEWHNIYKKVPDVTPTPKETPTPTPTKKPTPTPTATPTEEPTPTPTATPTEKPTPTPTATPTEKPTPTPTATPTEKPTPTPTATPTEEPTPTPTATPTATPTVTPATATPSVTPTATPTATPTGSEEPTPTPTVTPTATTPTTTTTSTPPVTTIKNNKTPLTTIKESKTPKAKAVAPKSKTTTILDEDVPLSDSAPETGDTTNLFIPIFGMGISLLAIVAVLFLRRRRS